jgi:alanyl-tRNA synthetase
MQSANDIRKAFLEYFADNGHTVVESSPLVPRNDPTLLFTNAGMVQFKNVFTGQEKRDYVRAATSQKCVRAGGKHNDLENVGYTARHHTFFEMLGNFSFGDYFKERAIELAWNLVHKEYGLAKDRLMVTVFSEDDEAFALWRKIAGLPESKIVRIPTSDNFWAMGDTGPCGPCSEIFYDHGDDIPGGPPGSPDADGDRFIEIWNLVFMQFEQVTREQRVGLPRPSIDTGMGLERITAVMQGVHNNYDIDLFRTLIEASADATGAAPDGPQAASHRVIADHLRSTSFLIADGVLPSNEGRGYVLRRIMRRAMRHAQMLGCEDPVIYKLVSTLVGEMGQAFPELIRGQPLITETIKLEEERFSRTLSRGLRLLEEATEGMGKGARLSGEVAFRLYDTYGFPLDLTQDALRPRGIAVDTDGFDAAMAKQKEDARKAWAGSGEAATETIWFGLREEVGATEFLGYDTEAAEGRVSALIVDGKRESSAMKGTPVQIVVNQTPFYGESGGQMGDAGLIVGPNGRVIVDDAQKKLGDLIVHYGRVEHGSIEVGDAVRLEVDQERRRSLRANHSATHLLHAALRRTLGEHVTQKGSMVAAERLRFDISHPKQVTPDEIAKVEAIVNRQVRTNTDVTTRLMEPAAAVKAGAMALFGEKYGDEVRVLTMGDENGHVFSTELCGGTHARRTGDIGFFKIVSEAAVGAGVRRIEALTGAAAEAYAAEEEKSLIAAAAALKVSPNEVATRVGDLVEERRKLEREVADLRRRIATGGGAAAASNEPVGKTVAGTKYLAKLVEGVDAKDLKNVADDFKKQIGSGVVAVISAADGKASLVVGVTDDLTGRLSAVDLVRVGSAALGGKGGGGRPDLAQAGGPDGSRAQDAFAAIEAALG